MKTCFFLILALLSGPFILLSILMILGVLKVSHPFDYFISSAFVQSLMHSLQLSSMVAFISLGIGGWMAYGFFSIQKRGYRSIYFFILLLLFMIQPVILLSIFNHIKLFTQISAFWQSVLIAVLHLFPLASLLWIYLFSLLNKYALDASFRISSLAYSWKYIILPQMKSRIGTMFLLLFILVFIDQEVPSILGYRTYAEDLLAQMTLMEDMKHIVLAALPSFIMVSFMVWAFISFVKNRYGETSFQIQYTNQANSYIGNSMLILMLFYLLWMIFVLVMELTGASLRDLIKENGGVIVQSISLSFLTALFSLLIILLLKEGLARYQLRLITVIVTGILFFYLLMPHALISLALLVIYQQIGYLSESADFVLFFIGYLFILFPVTAVLVYLFQSNEKKDHFLTFFATSVYDRWTKIFLSKYRVQWSITLFITVLFALNELSVSILLVPPGFETMVIRIYNLLHYGDRITIAFLSLVQLLFVMLIFIFLGWLSKKVIK